MIYSLTCAECGKDFTTDKEHVNYNAKKRGRAYCTPACGYRHRDRTRWGEKWLSEPKKPRKPKRARTIGPVQPRKRREPKPCPVCSVMHGRQTQTCSSVCAKIHVSNTMARTNRKYASDRMIERNPMRHQEIRNKVSSTLRAMKHKPPVQGGNGKDLPAAEKELIRVLSVFGFVPQYAIPTGVPRGMGYPTCYKPDMAHPVLKIAVEADGRSHESVARKAQDEKKDTFLRCKGWTVLRFTNEQIMTDVQSVVFTISKSMSSILTSQTAS